MRDPDEGLVAASDVPPALSRVGDRLAWYASSVGLERWARLASVALIPLLAEGNLRPVAPLFTALLGYVLLTAVVSRGRYLRAADLAVAAAVIFVAGADVSAFLPFLAVTVAGPAARGGPRAGLAAGGTLTTVLLARWLTSDDLGAMELGQVSSIILLLLLVGLTTALASQVLTDRTVQDRFVLKEANRLLSSLRDIADDIPGGLDVSTVCAALVAELRGVPGASGLVVYTEDHGVLRPAAAEGVQQAFLATVRVDELQVLLSGARLHTPNAFPNALRPALHGQRHWSLHPLGSQSPPRGMLLVGFDDFATARAAQNQLASLAADGGLALENARLFDGTRSRAADAARRHVAGDLHDGVAQSLAHLRMELELMAMADGNGPDGEVARLARVAASALTDLRATITGLRRPADGDLASLLARYLDDVGTSHGPSIDLESEGAVQLDPDRTEELLRIAQEAVSNALRHAEARRVVVRLDQDGDEVVFTVEDDGVGRRRPTLRRGGGVGMRSMRDRAERLGGGFDVGDRPGGGTYVTVRFPTVMTSSLSRR